ncbi:MAG: 7-cyano-7-deazaguanine synthase QueC [Planctomycetia bacterium]|nr:7-cyano-7-deazaguanine synthase QueC [Planctomycetia bacterium]
MKTRAVILLSGGLDSSTVCACAAAEEREIHALTFDYNQRNRVELNSARAVARRWNVQEHLIFPVDLSLFGGSSLVDPNMEVRKDVPLEKIGEKIPTSYVPARNTVFLSLALAFAETRKASEIWIGVNHVDYSGYPDCRPEFIQAFENLAALATRMGTEEGSPLKIRTPLLNLKKGEIILLGLRMGVDYSQTCTCYSPFDNGQPCGHCESCLLRQAGFEEAGISDPLLERFIQQ